MTHYDPFWSIWSNLIHFDQILPILDRSDLIWSIRSFWSSLIHYEPLRSILIRFDSFWSNLFHFDPFWSNLIQFDPLWSNLTHFGHFWSILIHLDPIRIDMIQTDKKIPIQSSDPCSTRRWIQFAWHGYCACQTHYSSKNFWLGWRIFKILHWIFESGGLYINDNFI